MKQHHPLMARACGALAVVSLLAGCAASGTRKEDTNYYYQSRVAAPAAPRVATVQPPPPAPVAERGPAGVSRIVYFDYDAYEVKPQYLSVVQAHADYLRSRPQSRVQLEGHTDVRGGTEYNMALGQRRSDAVARLLSHGGAPRTQYEGISWGKERLSSTQNTEEAHQSNRRVEFIYR